MSQSESAAEQNIVPSWYREIYLVGEFDGFHQKYGNHSACFIDREPWAGKFCADNGWSHFGIFAQGPTWFRDQRLIDWLEQQRDAGFFKKFDRVAFSGKIGL